MNVPSVFSPFLPVFFFSRFSRASADFVTQTCNSGSSLDLSVGAFTALAAESVGLFEMTWSFV